MKVLHAASECVPLAKTGGLADVLGALPGAQAALGVDVRVVVPAYRGAAARLPEARGIGELTVRGQRFGIIEGRVGGATTWLLDCPGLYDRPGDPYHDASGVPHADNAWRFGCFGEAAARLAQGEGAGWRADVLHGHDWQAGVALAYAAEAGARPPGRVFTIHNLAYHGTFGRSEFDALRLPPHWWHVAHGEFHGLFSFLKAGIVSAQAITTVSPRYAEEIRTPAFGCGLEGLLRERSASLAGILNGIDDAVWNPAADPLLARRYGPRDVTAGKRANAATLREELKLVDDGAFLVGAIGRFTSQKGFDLLLEAAPALIAEGMQFAVLGSGDKPLEAAYRALAERHPGRVGLKLGYDERLAHRIEAGADAFLMASRFEPCGLNQMYSQRYGTVPVVHAVGGLADTVADATAEAIAAGQATGVRFENADAGGVLYGLRRARELHARPAVWKAMQRAGMARDFSWARAAGEYAALYSTLSAAVPRP